MHGLGIWLRWYLTPVPRLGQLCSGVPTAYPLVVSSLAPSALLIRADQVRDTDGGVLGVRILEPYHGAGQIVYNPGDPNSRFIQRSAPQYLTL